MRSSGYSVNDNDDILVSGFDESTSSGESVCDIFYIKDEIITEDSTICVRVIKIPFSDLPQDFNNLKLIWINTKGNIGF